MIHSRNLVANGHVLDGFGCAKMSRWIRDNRRNRGSIVDALARVDGTTFAKYVSEVATAISGWLLRESRRCRRHGWCVVVAFFVGRGRRGERCRHERGVRSQTREAWTSEKSVTRIFQNILRKMEDSRDAWHLRRTSAQNICVNEILLLCSKKSILIIGGGSRWKDDDKVTVTTNSNTNS